MLSTQENPKVVSDYIDEEVKVGRVLGPISPLSDPRCQVSLFGVIPKGNRTGKWRLIVDLSSPESGSVNEGISQQLCTLTYVSVDDIAAKILELGRGTMLAKLDIQSAYRLVPVHPDDRPLLGMKWEEKLYLDTALPFGLRSAPKIFTAVADALEWAMKMRGVSAAEHYLDDFILLGSEQRGKERSRDPEPSECDSQSLPKSCEESGESGSRMRPPMTR